MAEPQKYTLSTTSKTVYGVRLFQIIRTADGAVGGWLESEANLSQQGTAWVFGEAQVYGQARVSGQAVVYDQAQVYDQDGVDMEAWLACMKLAAWIERMKAKGKT